MTSEVYKLRKVDGEKQKRINSFKIKLEGSSQGVHEMVTSKDGKIKALEEMYVLPSSVSLLFRHKQPLKEMATKIFMVSFERGSKIILIIYKEMFLGCDWLIRVQLMPNITQNSANL